MINEFRQAYLNQSILLLEPIIGKRIDNIRSETRYGVNPYTPKFYGHNPLTGLPVTIVFNEPSPGRASLMNWNPSLKSWMYSNDAGLTWKPVEFMDYIEKVDCLCDKPEYDGDK